MTLTPEQQERLVRVGPGTPAGRMLRRYWHPIEISANLRERPLPIRLLGENLVLFRDQEGRPCLLDDRCMHRGTALHTGRVVNGCIECPYHGWMYDGRGQCVAQPAERPEYRFAERVRTTAYCTYEIGGVIFAYLGPGSPPPFPTIPELLTNTGRRQVFYRDNMFNYFQLLENDVDPVHTAILHRDSPFEKYAGMGRIPTIYPRETDYGIEMVAYRPATEDFPEYRRVTNFYMPNLLRLELPYVQPPIEMAKWVVPLDDTTCRTFIVQIHHTTLSPELQREAAIIPEQDSMAVSRQGVIYDRTRERLGESDRGIILLRKLYFRAIAEAETISTDRERGYSRQRAV
jgi:nitrite reductase/ring-hydroxylating ferredoxin subunit